VIKWHKCKNISKITIVLNIWALRMHVHAGLAQNVFFFVLSKKRF